MPSSAGQENQKNLYTTGTEKYARFNLKKIEEILDLLKIPVSLHQLILWWLVPFVRENHSFDWNRVNRNATVFLSHLECLVKEAGACACVGIFPRHADKRSELIKTLFLWTLTRLGYIIHQEEFTLGFSSELLTKTIGETIELFQRAFVPPDERSGKVTFSSNILTSFGKLTELDRLFLMHCVKSFGNSFVLKKEQLHLSSLTELHLKEKSISLMPSSYWFVVDYYYFKKDFWGKISVAIGFHGAGKFCKVNNIVPSLIYIINLFGSVELPQKTNNIKVERFDTEPSLHDEQSDSDDEDDKCVVS